MSPPFAKFKLLNLISAEKFMNNIIQTMEEVSIVRMGLG